MQFDENLLHSLIDILGRGGVKAKADLAGLDPGTHPDNLRAEAMVLPRSTQDVSRILALCNDRRVAVVPQGGRTGLSGASSTGPGEIILSLDRLSDLESIDAAGRTALVGAGCRLGPLAAKLSELGLSVGIDLGARDSCTIGGLIATNAGGMEAFRHGVMRQRVMGLEAVLADGTVLSDLSRVAKANTGYDVKQLFIGAEGTLGVITRAALALVEADGPTALALVACAEVGAATALMRRLQGIRDTTLTRAELMSGNHFRVTVQELKFDRLAQIGASEIYVLFELAGGSRAEANARLEDILAAELEAGSIADALIAQSDREVQEMWRVREDWAVDRVYPGALWFDVSAPIGQLGDYIAAATRRVKACDPALDLYFIGHLADGNLHVTVNARHPIKDRYEEISRLVYAGLDAMGGAFSAEHGIGLEKRAALVEYGPMGKLAIMRRLKAALDPHNIMNPGKVIAPE